MFRLANIAKQNHGFTLMEVLLVVAIISILTMVSAPVVLTLQRTNELDVAANTLAQYLYQAQGYSREEAHDCSWGVTIHAQDLTLFCGNSYVTRNPNFDNSYEIPANVKVGQNQEIIYDKLTGHPQTTGSYELSVSRQTSTVSVNSKGM